MKVDTRSIEEYLANAGERKDDIRKLHSVIIESAPSLLPGIFNGMSITMIGYGIFHYKYASGREGDWPVIGLATQKRYISLYICLAQDGKYLAEKYQSELGKVNCGRSCIRFKKYDDLNISAVQKVLRKAEVLSKDPTNFQVY